MGILFLPEDNLGEITNFLRFVSKSDNTAVAFGYYLLNKVITGAGTFLIIFVVFRGAKNLYEKYGPDSNEAATETEGKKIISNS